MENMISVNKETVNGLIRMATKLSYMVLVLEQVCEVRDVKAVLPASEVCKLLGIKGHILEDYRKRGLIKSVNIEGHNVYSAFEIAKLGEKVKRRHRLRQLAKIPVIKTE